MSELVHLIFLLTTAVVLVHAQRVAEDDITFYLSNNEYSYEEFTTGDYTNFNIDISKDVKIICHGWLDSVSATWYFDAKEQYGIRGSQNVIGVDWSAHSISTYLNSVRSTESVGEYIALLISDMSRNLGIPLSQFHIIGHSLGAHIAGYAGQHVQAMTGGKVGRITGLDPARPLFEGNQPNDRLSDDDADFVDVIHTDAGTLGYKASIGHVDFYPNGGSRQNGCGLIMTSNCSHNRAPTLFYESINSNSFVAVACSSYTYFTRGNCDDNQRAIMGEEVDQNARGDFYLDTASSSPFALGIV